LKYFYNPIIVAPINNWNYIGVPFSVSVQIFQTREIIYFITKMEHIKSIERRTGVDVGYHSSNIHPIDRDGCVGPIDYSEAFVGKYGINKTYTFEKVLELAYKMDNKPNIIIKAGENAKWYLKHFQRDKIEDEIEKQKWRDTKRYTMYIIDWE
jgi:hypothetical protein